MIQLLANINHVSKYTIDQRKSFESTINTTAFFSIMVATFHANSGTVHIPSSGDRTPDIRRIPEWLIWSILNIFIGWGLGGMIPLIFTLLCRYNKRNNNLKESQTMSKLALISNIIVTLCGIAGWIIFIILSIYARRMYNMRSTKQPNN